MRLAAEDAVDSAT